MQRCPLSMQPNPLYVALDTADLELALALAQELGPYVGGLKVGLEFVSAHGPTGVRRIVELGRPVFLDVKLHDIPTTVAGAVRALAQLGVAIVNVHASGGVAMMRAAKDAAGDRMKVIGVTILTALGDDDMTDVGMTGSASEQALRLAKLAQFAGLDGVVCGAPDLAPIRAACGPNFLTAVPGSRPEGTDTLDQRRFLTPEGARAAGADIVILGRPVTSAADRVAALRAIAASL